MPEATTSSIAPEPQPTPRDSARRPRRRRAWAWRGWLVALAAIAACQPAANPAPTAVTRYRPARDLGPLFRAVQLDSVFPDSKTFVDAELRLPARDVLARYVAARGRAGFD
ncbi:MAG: hypothetical protein ACREL5_14425, partial [Gemmatimonadales bacterium]